MARNPRAVDPMRAAMARSGPLDWGNLLFFLELSRSGSLARAAKRLGVDRNTVGRRVAALEEELGLPLFERGPQGWACTAAGEELAALASRVEEDVLAIARHADARDRTPAGTVPSLRARHPRLLLDVSADFRNYDLTRREADLALRLGRPSDAGLVARKLASVAYGIYASPAFAAERRGRMDLARDPVLAYEGATSPQERWMDDLAPARAVAFRCNTSLALAAAARTGIGAAVLPCFVADGDPALVRLDGPEPPSYDLWLLVHGDLRRVPRVRAVIEWVDGVVDDARELLAGTR
ncbi:transcriptional regulator, LysR family [Anaeromyxobacter dehalogenans 2CP-1]|uniref:Transcriptional regulator, LysR family n=1 Tax=Anaeromyxobacter dehalogenans (strain ATCC BAA-258 / DSM 21875 / 2CP-1) TaxID=455488 RepID=B8JF30_ANAD2|nr:LysR family transcriptional regulator [Anaeromyxobacter dehalogenans]ACL64387.1 transcriptional regulator, LysR family [Anaeromyxobacter dehalogenans 2CP-1]